jgi:predicted small secreted protein
LIPQSEYAESRPPRFGAPEAGRVGTLRNRVAVTAVVVLVCFAVSALGAVSKVELSEAQQIDQDVGGMRDLLAYGGVQMIFGNNLMYDLLMFIPFLGPFFGSYVLYSTGRVIAAVGLLYGRNPLVLFVSLFVYPFAWMEYIAYAMAISESLWLVYMATKHRFRAELTNAAKVIAICAIVLLVSAFIEVILIMALQA